jgi:hypothetical protein
MKDQAPSTEAELVEFVRAIDVRAPDSLHRRVESLVAGSRPRGRRPRAGSVGRSFRLAPRLAAAGAIAGAVAAVAIAVGLSGGGSSTLSQRQAVALTLRPATQAAPAESTINHTELAAAVEGVSFPYWEGRLGWRSTGARTDRVGGRTVRTIFYSDGRGHRIGYAIVAGSPPQRPSGGVVQWRGSTPYRLLAENGVPAVVWLRHHHLCVVSARGVSGATLLRLASWADRSTAS